MGTATENRCFRCRTDCVPLANLSASVDASSFVCVGLNRKEDRAVPQDRFTLCWKNDAVDERGHWDKRDLLDTMSVIAQALSTDENIRVSNDFTEADMQQVNMTGEPSEAHESRPAPFPLCDTCATVSGYCSAPTNCARIAEKEWRDSENAERAP